MAVVQLNMYANAVAKMLNKEIDWDTDTVRVTAHTSTYTPNAATHDYFNDATNELSTANGYTANGTTIGTKSVAIVAANSWAQTHAVSTAYVVGDIRKPSAGNGYVYRASVAGTSGGSAPTWPTVIGTTVADGGVTWTCVGTNVVRLLGDAATWSAPFDAGPFRHLVIWVDTGGASSTDPLIGYISYGSDLTGGGGSYVVTPDNGAWFNIPV